MVNTFECVSRDRRFIPKSDPNNITSLLDGTINCNSKEAGMLLDFEHLLYLPFTCEPDDLTDDLTSAHGKFNMVGLEPTAVRVA